MIIQSRRVWIAGQFIPTQILMEDGRITAIDTYGKYGTDMDHGEKRMVPASLISIPMALMALTPMMPKQRDSGTGFDRFPERVLQGIRFP